MAVTTTEILVDGSTAAVSSTVALEQGEVNTLVLRGADKHSGLSMKNKVEQVFGPGNYRLGAAWEAAAAKLFLWQKTGNTSAVASMAASMAAAATVILLIFLASWWFGPHGFFEN